MVCPLACWSLWCQTGFWTCYIFGFSKNSCPSLLSNLRKWSYIYFPGLGKFCPVWSGKWYQVTLLCCYLRPWLKGSVCQGDGDDPSTLHELHLLPFSWWEGLDLGSSRATFLYVYLCLFCRYQFPIGCRPWGQHLLCPQGGYIIRS